MHLGWKLLRLSHLAHRVAGSIAMRGWRGTVRRALHERPRVTDVTTLIEVRAPAGTAPYRRILIVDSMTPDPSRDSGSMRLCQIFALLHADGWAIDFLADDGDTSPADAARLAELGVRIVTEPPLPWLAREGRQLEAVMLCRLPVADQYHGVVRRYAPHAKLLFDTVDLHFIREQRAAELAGTAALVRRARRSERRELDMVHRSDIVFVVSGEERAVLSTKAPSSQVEVVSNIHAARGRTGGFQGRSGLLFVGGFGHPPNEDAVRWFVDEVLPLLLARDPSIVLHVVGDIDLAARRRIEREGVVVHGRVPDLTPLLDRSLVSVAPLRFGAGVKGKVNQAMSHGLPVVLTRIAAEGMHLQDGVNAMIADHAAEMAAAILRLHHDEALWLQLSDAGLNNIRQYFSAEQALAALRRALGTRPS
ncbi:glycosyltransferase [Dyella sp. BiH032]|uniref:glycosyltransferase n=1 Tax=Dyella sp. BiH032 TaxID=3075430 RepID=UPI00289316B9|nr:glycosyltransferase [Dyella sp. BiH032]WNL45529.1 glycosyltransferase [Dyella sp. BiH032]